MEQKYTPGPWSHEPLDTLNPRDLQRPWIGRLDEGRFSALACGETKGEAFANARLIAAAPEMAETLRRIARTAEMSAGIMRDKRRTGGWEGAEKTADAFARLAEDAREAFTRATTSQDTV